MLEDANSIQVAVRQVMRLLLSAQIEHRTASLLLYGLQTASLNLRTANVEPARKETIVIDPNAVEATPLGENLWNREDFAREADEEATPAIVEVLPSPPHCIP